jgi:ArsR family transcriptional regulator
MEPQKERLFQIHAEYCSVLANAKRLMIMDCLRTRGEMSVGEIAEAIEAPLSTVSQHLKALKSKYIVVSRKEGQTVYYRPTDERLMQACVIIREVLIEGMKKRGELAYALDPSADSTDEEE